jgi:2-methylcitrate dehydratase
MVTASRAMSRFAYNLRYEDLSPEVIRYSKQLILDTLGVALGGYLSEPSFITRNLIKELGGRPESTIIGSGDKTSSSLAALANGVMVRYLDFSDVYIGSEDVCHPSENIPVALSVAEREHSTGKNLLLAIYLGYEFQGRLADTFNYLENGFHHVTMGGYVTPLVSGKLLGLTEEQMTNALGIASCSSLTAGYLGGHITMMKALGYALAAQRGIEASIMAKKGMTGPDYTVERFNQIIKQNRDLTSLIKDNEKPRILRTAIKPYAAQFMTHVPLEALFSIVKENNLTADDVDSMHLWIFKPAIDILADKQAYKPETREKADHSLPYCLAIGLLEGNVGPAQFSHEQFKDPKILDLMSRIKVSEDSKMNEIYPKARPAELEIRTKNGEIYSKRINHPKGDPNNPMTEEEVQFKFRNLLTSLLRENQIQNIIQIVNSIEHLKDVGELMQLLII